MITVWFVTNHEDVDDLGAFLEEWFGPGPNSGSDIRTSWFGNPNLQVRNPNLSFGSGIVEYDVKIFNHRLIWVSDDNLNVKKKLEI